MTLLFFTPHRSKIFHSCSWAKQEFSSFYRSITDSWVVSYGSSLDKSLFGSNSLTREEFYTRYSWCRSKSGPCRGSEEE